MNQFDADIKKHAVTSVICHKYVHLDTFLGKNEESQHLWQCHLIYIREICFCGEMALGSYFWI